MKNRLKTYITPSVVMLFLVVANPAFSQDTIISGTTSVNLDFTALETAASLQLSSVDNTSLPAAPFPAGFAITSSTPLEYNADPFSLVGGSIDHLGSVTFTIVGTENTVEVGDFTIGFDGSRATEGNSGYFVEDTISGLGILFDVAAPDTLVATPDGILIEGILRVSPEFAAYLTTNNLATTDLTGVDIGSAQVNASTEPVTISSGATSVTLDFETLETAASLAFASVENTASPAIEFPAGFAITPETPFQYTLEPFAPVAGNISHTGSLTFTIAGTEDQVTLGNFSIGYDAARASNENSGFFVEDTLAGLGILFDVATPTTLGAGGAGFFVEAPLNVSPEFATYLTDNNLAETDLTGAEVGAAQINSFAAPPPLTPNGDNEFLSISTRCFVGSEAFTDLANASIIIGGTDPMTVVFRGRSTSISEGITAAKLSDPVIDVVQLGVGVIGTNDNFADADGLSMLQGTLLDPAVVGMSDNESLLILENLEPGAYSVRVRSAVEGETGLVIVEAIAVE